MPLDTLDPVVRRPVNARPGGIIPPSGAPTLLMQPSEINKFLQRDLIGQAETLRYVSQTCARRPVTAIRPSPCVHGTVA